MWYGQLSYFQLTEISDWGSQIAEPLLMLTAKCPLKVQISQGPGLLIQLELLKTGREGPKVASPFPLTVPCRLEGPASSNRLAASHTQWSTSDYLLDPDFNICMKLDLRTKITELWCVCSRRVSFSDLGVKKTDPVDHRVITNIPKGLEGGS